MNNETGQSPNENTSPEEAAEAREAREAEIHALLKARYPNTRRLQRAIIRLAELDPDGHYTGKADVADPAFQRIVRAGGLRKWRQEDPDGPAAPETPPAAAPGPLALKVEPIVVKSSTEAGHGSAVQVKPTSQPTPAKGK